jgi:hypothetical protein
MKIAKWQKEAIVRAIMADVPEVDSAKISADIQAALVKVMSPDARKLYRSDPKALATRYIPGTLANHGLRDFIVGNAAVDSVIKPWKEQAEARSAARRDVRAAVESCNTLAQLKARMPEFSKYFPTEAEPTKNLPAVIDLVPSLAALGWPLKGGKKC